MVNLFFSEQQLKGRAVTSTVSSRRGPEVGT